MIAKLINRAPASYLINIVEVYLCYAICRFAFLLENWQLFNDDISWDIIRRWMYGGFMFDTSAIFYTNAIYLLFVLLPLHYKETAIADKFAKWWFIAVNSLCIIMNLMDAVYFSFTNHRATSIIFDEFKNEHNLTSIVGGELFRHWYLIALSIFLIGFLAKSYRTPQQLNRTSPLWKYYTVHSITLIAAITLAVGGIRGGFTTAIRPLAIGNAHQYVDKPAETGIVLNTPFAIIRTIDEKPFNIPIYFTDRATLDSLYSPIHYPTGNASIKKKNIVILIVESFAKEFIGAYNQHLDGGNYHGYTPFTDSLLCHSLTFEETISNSGFSIDAIPAVLSSIPRMGKPFVLTPYSLNARPGLGTELKKWGYETAFFHEAENSSMGFQASARAAGFSKYYGRTEYNQCPAFNGDKDFDGTWAIWDEPFLQYFCMGIGQMKQPFCAAVFTASSHHPFAIPEEYKEVFKDEGIYPMHKCIRYTDNALRKFFETAKRQPWYKNTLFVLTADHASSKTTHDEYKTEMGHCRIPILFFDPSSEMPVGCHKGIAQQIDIMPTLLGYLGYDKPYIAFGKDMLHTSPTGTWALRWDNIPVYIKGDYMLQSNGKETTGIYAYRTDRLLKNNLKGKVPEEEAIERSMKAFMQSYMERMKADSLTIK